MKMREDLTNRENIEEKEGTQSRKDPSDEAIMIEDSVQCVYIT